MSTYTSGPWTARESFVSENGNLWFVDADASIGMQSGRVAEVWNADNARLIAAAPELLDVLKGIAARVGKRAILTLSIVDVAEIRAAIAKAEGR